MGSGSYSTTNSIARSVNYLDMAPCEIFTQKSINNAMSPHGIVTRESRDSEEHPKSLAVILGLDVTGSMGSVPNYLIKEGLVGVMETILQRGVNDPQLLFLGIGDHECDRSPLQVAQFESSDELLDKWLRDVYLEGGGGGNYGESYSLAWYLAAFHTSIDCFEKRKEKGLLFTIGDEPCLKETPKKFIKDMMGSDEFAKNYTHHELLEKAQEKYHVYHLHIKQTASGSRQEVMDGWKQLMGDNLIIIDNYKELDKKIAETILKHASIEKTEVEVVEKIEITETEIIL